MKYSNYDDDDNDNDRGLSLPVIYTMIAMAGIVLIVILVVVSQNTRSSNRKTAAGLTPTPVVEAVDLRDGESGEEERTQACVPRIWTSGICMETGMQAKW